MVDPQLMASPFPIEPVLNELTEQDCATVRPTFTGSLDETRKHEQLLQDYTQTFSETSTEIEDDGDEDGHFEVIDDDSEIPDGNSQRDHDGEEIPPRPPSRVGMARDFLIYEDGGGEDEHGWEEDVGNAIAEARGLDSGHASSSSARGPSTLSSDPASRSPSPHRRGSGGSIQKHRSRAQRNYRSIALREGRSASPEGIDEMMTAPLQRVTPSLEVLSPPRPTTLGENAEEIEEGEEWRALDGAVDDDSIDKPLPSTQSPVSSSSANRTSRFNNKENSATRRAVGNRNGSYPDASDMDISPPGSPRLPFSPTRSTTISPPPPVSDSGSTIDISTSSCSSTSSSSPSSSDEDSESTASGEATRRPQLTSRSGNYHSQPKPLSLRSIHASVVAQIKRDCATLIKKRLVPLAITNQNPQNVEITSLIVQNHVRNAFKSFESGLSSWQIALESALTTSPPKGKITLPGYLSLVPIYAHLILELNSRIDPTSIFEEKGNKATEREKGKEPERTRARSYTQSRSPRLPLRKRTPTTRLRGSNHQTPFVPPPPPPTPPPPPKPISQTHALCRLALAELCIAAYLSEYEMYSCTLSLPSQSPAADIVRKKLLRRITRETAGGLEEANMLSGEMWKGEWGVKDPEEKDGRGVVRTRANRILRGVVKARNGELKRELRNLKEEEEKWEKVKQEVKQDRGRVAREFTWWWEGEEGGRGRGGEVRGEGGRFI